MDDVKLAVLTDAKTAGITCSSSIAGYYIGGLNVYNQNSNTIQIYSLRNKIEKFIF